MAIRPFTSPVALQEPLARRFGWPADHLEVVIAAVGFCRAAALG